MTQPTIKIGLLAEFLFTKGFQRLTWCGGKMTCYGSNNKAWTSADIQRNTSESGDLDLRLTWALVESALEGHDQPFTLILGAHPPEEKK